MKSQSVRAKPDAELAKWCEVLTTSVVEDEVPEGWYTADQLCQKLKRPQSTVGRLLLAAIRDGKCERKKFRVNCGSFVRPVPHYKLT